MPNTKSAKKRLKQNEARRERNRAEKSVLKTKIRKVRASVAQGNRDAMEQDFRTAAQRLDQAAARGVIHPNRAARLKSRLRHHIKVASTQAS